MNTSYIALGTNIEPRLDYIDEALAILADYEQITIDAKSNIYETAPVGYLDQSHFLNLVIRVSTSFSPVELLDVCQSIELRLGRERKIKNGPRTIDLDILLYNEENIQTDRLTVPHPRMQDRAFVLVPLEDIARELYIPLFKKDVRTLLMELPEKDKLDVLEWRG